MDVPRPTSADPDRRRRLASLAVLVVASLATIGTSPSPGASVQAIASGQVEVGSGGRVERSLEIDFRNMTGIAPGTARLIVKPKTVDGTQDTSVAGLVIEVVDAGGSPLHSESSDPSRFSGDLPILDCTASCDVAYRLIFVSRDRSAAQSTIRFDVDVDLFFPGASSPDPGRLTLRLDGPQIVNGQWISIPIAILGLLAGLLSGRRLHARRWIRFAPGLAIIVLLVAAASTSVLIPSSLDAPFWDTVPLVALTGGVAWGLHRWARGDPRSLVVVGWGVVIIGGIVFVGMVGLMPGYRLEILVPAAFIVWWLVGTMTGQALSTPTSTDRIHLLPTTVAVVSQAVILIGLIGYGVGFLIGPFGSPIDVGLDGLLVPALIAGGLVILGLRRWFDGRGAVMGWVNVLLFLVGGVGLLGISAISSLGFGSSSTFLVEMGPAAIVSLGACGCGVVAAFNAPPLRRRLNVPDPLVPDDPPIPAH